MSYLCVCLSSDMKYLYETQPRRMRIKIRTIPIGGCAIHSKSTTLIHQIEYSPAVLSRSTTLSNERHAPSPNGHLEES